MVRLSPPYFRRLEQATSLEVNVGGSELSAAIAPHCPYGPVLAAASLQLDACIPNFLIQEGCSSGLELLKEPFVIREGHIEVSKKPGLGIELDEEAIIKHPYEPGDVPRWYHQDGSFADW